MSCILFVEMLKFSYIIGKWKIRSVSFWEMYGVYDRNVKIWFLLRRLKGIIW